MITLFHHNMCCSCRAIRLILFEYNLSYTLIEEYEWERREEFIKINPSGRVPVLLTENDEAIIEPYAILEFLHETIGSISPKNNFFPETPLERAEVRRLVYWFFQKFRDEVTRPIVCQRIYKREMPSSLGGGAPDSTILRLAKTNIKPHMEYVNWLAGQTNCLVGDKLTYADFAAAGCISVLDYLNEINWEEYPHAKEWYMRIKSRPSMRPLLSDRVRGLMPSTHYNNLDF